MQSVLPKWRQPRKIHQKQTKNKTKTKHSVAPRTQKRFVGLIPFLSPDIKKHKTLQRSRNNTSLSHYMLPPNKESSELNHTREQLFLASRATKCCTQQIRNIVLSVTHKIFCKNEHILSTHYSAVVFYPGVFGANCVDGGTLQDIFISLFFLVKLQNLSLQKMSYALTILM